MKLNEINCKLSFIFEQSSCRGWILTGISFLCTLHSVIYISVGWMTDRKWGFFRISIYLRKVFFMTFLISIGVVPFVNAWEFRFVRRSKVVIVNPIKKKKFIRASQYTQWNKKVVKSIQNWEDFFLIKFHFIPYSQISTNPM